MQHLLRSGLGIELGIGLDTPTPTPVPTVPLSGAPATAPTGGPIPTPTGIAPGWMLDQAVPLRSSSPLGWAWPDTPLLVAITVIGAVLTRFALHRAIDKAVEGYNQRAHERDNATVWRAGRVLAEATGFTSARQAQRMATIGSLLRSVTSIVVGTIAILMVLSLVGLPLAPVLASAGVGGVALGFGAQSLVKDFLSGIFMMVEDQYGVGDLVDTGEVTGTVEEVTLRITRLRDPSGVVWYVRNGEIIRVANKSQGWATALVDIPVAYDENAERVIEILRTALDPMADEDRWKGLLLEKPDVVGVESIAGGSMIVRVTARCAPNENWSVQRGILERGKRALDEAGVRGPLPPFAHRPQDDGAVTGSENGSEQAKR